MNKNLKFASAFLGLFFVLSCTKTSAPVPGEKNMTTAIKKENYTTANSENSRYGSEAVLLNRGENVNTDLASFFRSYDTNILKSFRYEIAGPMMADENPANVQYMINKNAELINILSLINPVSFSSNEMSSNDDIVIYAGLLELYLQLAPPESTSVNRAPFPWECIWSVIAGYVDGRDLIKNTNYW